MTDKADHIAWTAEAVAVFQEHCRTGDEHAIADLICDLGHLAEDRGFDFAFGSIFRSKCERGDCRFFTPPRSDPPIPRRNPGRTRS